MHLRDVCPCAFLYSLLLTKMMREEYDMDGLIFAVFGGFASFGIGCATQVNAIARGLFSNRMQAVFAENDKQDRNKENRRKLWKKNMG